MRTVMMTFSNAAMKIELINYRVNTCLFYVCILCLFYVIHHYA